MALLRIAHLKAYYVQSVCFYSLFCAQGRLSAACHLPWLEQRDGQRADQGGEEVGFNQLPARSQSRFFMVNLRVLYVQRKPAGPWIRRPIDTEGRLINPVLLKLPVCVEYEMTRVCSSQHRSLFLMFDRIMSFSLDVTVPKHTEHVHCVCVRGSGHDFLVIAVKL